MQNKGIADEKTGTEHAASRLSHEVIPPGVGDKAEDMNVDTRPPSTTATTQQDATEKAINTIIDEKPTPPTTATTEDGITESSNPEPAKEHIAGLKLFLVISAISLVIFLMLLDMSIIVAVTKSSHTSSWGNEC